MIEVAEVGPKQLALALFGPYLLGVELASLLLLAGLVGAYHLGQRPHNRLQPKGN
jgi:NADH-quinone oxidoreductase subunit J